jgi:hypothetical protein
MGKILMNRGQVLCLSEIQMLLLAKDTVPLVLGHICAEVSHSERPLLAPLS